MLIKIIDGEPKKYSIWNLRRDNPNVSFPKEMSDKALAEYGIFRVVVKEQPEVGLGERLVQDETPVLENGVWTIGWSVHRIEVTKKMVDAERDRRIEGGFMYAGKLIQSDDDSIENILGAATSATAYITMGGDRNETYWQSQHMPFYWIAADNSPIPLTPEKMVEMGNAALDHKKMHIFAARSIKNMNPIPHDFADDKWWP